MQKREFFIRSSENPACPDCQGELEAKEWRKRVKKTAGGKKKIRLIEIRRCKNCGKSTTLLPDDQLPYKHYEEQLIEKVIDDELTEDEQLEIDNYPCEATIARWLAWAEQLKRNAEGQLRAAAYRILDLTERFLGSTESLLISIKERIHRGWLSVVMRVMVNTGGLGVIPSRLDKYPPTLF